MLLTVQNMYMYADVVLDSPIYAVINDCSSPLCLVFPTLVWMTINMALVFVGSYLVTFHAVSALSSSSIYSPVNTHYKKNICQWQVARKTQEFN